MNDEFRYDESVTEFRNTNLKKNSGYEHPENVKPELFK
jgi:hypothetical protein